MHDDLFITLRAAYQAITHRMGGQRPPLTEAEVHHLLSLFRLTQLDKTDYFVRAGEQKDRLGFLLSGLVRHYYARSDGSEVTVDFAAEFDLVGDYNCILLGKPADHYVQAVEPCQLVVAAYPDLLAAYAQFPRLEGLGRSFVEGYLARTLQQMALVMVHTPEERYRYLLTERPDLIRRVPQVLLASYVGVTPVSLSRIRRRMAVLGH